MNKPRLLILTGPTAVGKTEISIELAKKLNGEIISADSMQVYRYMDIGSAKITQDEMRSIKHHLIDILDPSEDFNVYQFKLLAKEALSDILSRGKLPIVVGGTGFYIQALLYDIDFAEGENTNSEYRKELEALAVQKGVKYLHDMLKDIDPESFKTIHENDTKRVIRALEYYHDTNEKISDHNVIQKQNESPYDFRYIVLNDDRKYIYDRIDTRVDEMIAKGLVDEVKSLKEKGYGMNNISMQGLGYKEIISYLDGEYDLDEAIRIIKRDSRHFAKRQLTWFKRERNVIFVDKQDFQRDNDKIINYIIKKCDWE